MSGSVCGGAEKVVSYFQPLYYPHGDLLTAIGVAGPQPVSARVSKHERILLKVRRIKPVMEPIYDLHHLYDRGNKASHC